MLHQGQPEQEMVDRPDVLPEGTTMERRADGSVWQITKAIPAHDDDGKEKPGPDFLSFRVDSVKDVDLVAKGGEPWYFKFIGESVPGRKAQGVDPAVAQLIAGLTERVEAAEARADAAEAAAVVEHPPLPIEVPLTAEGIEGIDEKIAGSGGNSNPLGSPKPAVLPKKAAGKPRSKK